MKKINQKKLRLDASTVRALGGGQANTVAGGQISVGTCSGCRATYCDGCENVTWAPRGQICV
jgi:hypothetical protein